MYITSNMSKMLERRDTSEPMHMYVFAVIQIRVLIRLVAAATIQERRLFHSTLAQVRLLFESGIYSRAASIRSYTIYTVYAWNISNRVGIYNVNSVQAVIAANGA